MAEIKKLLIGFVLKQRAYFEFALSLHSGWICLRPGCEVPSEPATSTHITSFEVSFSSLS